MKKLMIAAAIVCAAAISQGSTVTWSMSNIYPHNDAAKADGTLAYIFTGYSVSQVNTALSGVGAVVAAAWLESVANHYQGETADGSFGYATLDKDATSLGLVANGTSQSLVAVVFDTDTITESSMYYVKDTSATVPLNGNAGFVFGSQKNPSKDIGNWHAVAAVPEPTSGLLLLLGVAGLALRRRRA